MPPKQTDRLFPSMGACSSGTGLPLDVIKWAKKQGCPGFQGSGRVDEAELRKWLAKNPPPKPEETATIKEKKTFEEWRKLKLLNDLKEGKLVQRDSVIESIHRYYGQVSPLLDQKLENEYPSAVAGMDVAQARIYGKRLNDDLKKILREMSDAWAI